MCSENFPSVRSMLLDAIEKNYTESIIKILLKNPKLLENHNYLKHRLLEEAARSENGDVAELYLTLLYHELEANEKHLIISIFRDNVRLIEFLLAIGTKLESSQRNEYLPYMYKSVFRKIGTRMEILTLLLQYGQLHTNFHYDYGNTVLHEFVWDPDYRSDDDIEIAEILINSGISVNEIGFNHNAPLHSAACSKNNTQLVSFLIMKGADVNQKNGADNLPIHEAAEWNNVEMVDLLLSRGVDINVVSGEATALHCACFHYREETMKLLIRRGANIFANRNRFDNTPFSELMSAANYDPDDEDEMMKRKGCILLMVREFSKLAFENLPIFEFDMDLINENSETLEYFENCKNELKQMASTEFYAPYSFYSILKMSISTKRLALLAKNNNLVSKFEEKVCTFSCFKSDLQIIWEEAIQIRDNLEVVESRLNSVLCNFFPDVVLKKLAKNLTVEDLPL